MYIVQSASAIYVRYFAAFPPQAMNTDAIISFFSQVFFPHFFSIFVHFLFTISNTCVLINYCNFSAILKDADLTTMSAKKVRQEIEEKLDIDLSER